MRRVEEALKALRKGQMILLYDADGREEETDFVIASQFVKQEHVMRMRKDAGGLICVTVHPGSQEKLELPFLTDLYGSASRTYPVVNKLTPNDIPYDEKSAFTLTVNHRKTFTGISDFDRALTISEFAKLCSEIQMMNNGRAQDEFGKRFRSPGHIHLLNASKDLLNTRQGHTELSTSLMVMAEIVPSATICEMIGDNGRSTPKEESMAYAERNDLVFVEGREVIDAWNSKMSRRGKMQWSG